jgi:regulator of sigma D
MKTTHQANDEKTIPASERRRAGKDTVTKMVAERTEVLTLYWRLAGLEPFSDAKHEPAQKLLQEFCQLLVDYIAAGHFSLYERIINGTERRREVATLAQELYPRIADTTALALDFNDKYDGRSLSELPDSFQADLSRLGEELALRIDLEDKLIARLMA